MPPEAHMLAQQSPQPISQIRDGFSLLVILVGLGVALVVIALGLVMANRRMHGPRKKRRHAGPKVDAWKEAGSRARTPTAWELEKSNRPRPKKPKSVDPDAFEEGLESSGSGDPDGGGGGGGDGGGD